MDGPEALRAARRRAGLSQRQMAARAGCAASTLSGYESGRRALTVETLDGLLALAGLELVLGERLAPAPSGLREHLHRSLVERLYGSVERSGWVGAPGPRWRQLWALAARHPVQVVGAAAVGVWLPEGAADGVQVAVGDRSVRALPDGVADLAPDLALVPGAQGPAGTVAVSWLCWRLHIGSPAELALTASDTSTARALRTAARVLHEEQHVDGLDRRPPAHRDPHHELERELNRQTRRYGTLPVPNGSTSRSWRLGSPVGYLSWLGSLGYPESGARRSRRVRSPTPGERVPACLDS